MTERLSRGTRKHIREIKSQIREDVAKATPDQDWEAMHELLRLRLANFPQISADGRLSLIQEWFRTRQDIRFLPPDQQRERITEFQKKHSHEDLMAAKDALAIISQTLSR